jgi:hypothetical protein
MPTSGNLNSFETLFFSKKICLNTSFSTFKKVLNISRSELFYPYPQRCCTNDNARAFFVSPSLIYTTIPLLPRLRRGWGGGEVSHVAGGRGGGNSHTNWSADPERSYS